MGSSIVGRELADCNLFWYEEPVHHNFPTELAAVTNAVPMPTASALQLLYICDHDAYNCSDFNTQAAAQAVYNYCVSLGFGDIHRLDGNNNNGLACESLP